MSTSAPNFLLVLADDLGYSDIGCFGSEIKTPHLDALANEGIRLTDFHATAACSPTRAILLSGTDNHLAGVGCMSEQKAAGGSMYNVKGYEGYLNHSVVALPELLQEGGYHTMISGKWHLGLKPENNPKERGFDRSMALLPGCSNHYGYEPQFAEPANPFFERIPPLYSRDGTRMEVEPNVDHAPDGFYSSDTYAANMLDYLKDWEAGGKTKPFFAYLPFSAPHWPLQCSPADREAYKGVYDNGPETLRQSRLAGLKESGIIAEDISPAPVIAPEVNEWDEMTVEERRQSARAMETYAGMVTAMDRAIGRVIDYLRSINELDNTFVVFMSDNGAEGAAYEALPVLGKNLMKIIETFYDNSLDNIGNHDSFVWYGPLWAQAATAPHRMYKMYSTEGGIRVPFILRYPQSIPTSSNGLAMRAFTTVADICPTILEMANVKHPVKEGQARGDWHGRNVAAMRGKSWVKWLQSGEDGTEVVHGEDDPAYGWELFGRAALRKGKWKILHVGVSAGGRPDGNWQLYDIVADPGETRDMSDDHPEVMSKMLDMWDEYVRETGTVWGQALPSDMGKGWDSAENGVVGGDALEQTRAWMRVKNGMPPTATH